MVTIADHAAAVTTAKEGKLDEGGARTGNPCHALGRSCATPPFNVAALLACACALNVAIVQSSFTFAVTAQILMGTVYVFSMQIHLEMIAVFAHGSRAVHGRVAYRARIVFDCAVSVDSFCRPLSHKVP